MCDGSQQPVKLRKLCGGGAEVTAVPGQPAPSQDQLVDQAHTGLFQLLAGLGMEPVSVSFSMKTFSKYHLTVQFRFRLVYQKKKQVIETKY